MANDAERFYEEWPAKAQAAAPDAVRGFGSLFQGHSYGGDGLEMRARPPRTVMMAPCSSSFAYRAIISPTSRIRSSTRTSGRRIPVWMMMNVNEGAEVRVDCDKHSVISHRH